MPKILPIVDSLKSWVNKFLGFGKATVETDNFYKPDNKIAGFIEQINLGDKPFLILSSFNGSKKTYCSFKKVPADFQYLLGKYIFFKGLYLDVDKKFFAPSEYSDNGFVYREINYVNLAYIYDNFPWTP